uniref:Portal protein n=1 Tax=Siphoviridae sp. ctxMM9 TaxID=2827973 RepID=A0A8S5T7G1_9CAUD|nr:MAG TPA: portal protein [Siphoviridae sp. ctxMM9]
MFPDEFSKGYVLYKKGKLKSEYMGDTSGWYLLDTDCAFKINLNGDDYPMLVNAIPALIDLDSAQELDRKKMMQQLLKIVIQKLPLDKNNDLIFDVDEAKDIHNNAVQMLKRAVGVDVITTFADVAVENVSDKNTTTTTDELEKVERGVYNEFGVSENLFNSDGNIALNNSILNDEASIRDLIL